MKTTLCLLVMLLTHPLIVSSQDYTTKSRRAIKHYEAAIEAYNAQDIEKTIQKLESAIKADNEFIEAYLTLGDVYHQMGETEKEITVYRKGLDIKPEYYPRGYYNLGKAEFNSGMYEPALEHFENYIELTGMRGRNRDDARKLIQSCRFAMQAMKNPVPFNPENLGNKVNSEYDEYYPTLTADENTLIMTVQVPVYDRPGKGKTPMQEDFYVSHRDSAGNWQEAESIGEPLNTRQNEGAQSITTDGTIMFFTACNRSDGQGSCDIYFSFKRDGKWTGSINLGKPVNTRAWESQPSISPDGNTLYFVSNKSGGFGGMDVWKSELTDEGYWGNPVNLGDSINTSGDEKSPFIHFDNQTLYFASNGHTGMGKFDLFVSRKKDSATWTQPENLGYPINTFHNEEGLIVNARGNKAYYSSSREKNRGEDIFSFELHEKVQPVSVSYVKGKVYDAATREPLSAKFELINIRTSGIIMESRSRKENGEFILCLPINHNYALNVSKPEYLFHSENFSLDSVQGYLEPFVIDIPLSKKGLGETIVLKNVFFDTDKYQLRKESKAELDRLIQFMKTNQEVIGEVSGHTDDRGTEKENQQLSEKRAESVYHYLVENGISPERLSYKGYGESRPVATNDTPEGRAQNRRTEFTIIGSNETGGPGNKEGNPKGETGSPGDGSRNPEGETGKPGNGARNPKDEQGNPED